MVNVDGVQMGNFRCNATGTDLNRIWHKPIAVP
jgi:murein tripeptide amidase MpaA